MGSLARTLPASLSQAGPGPRGGLLPCGRRHPGGMGVLLTLSCPAPAMGCLSVTCRGSVAPGELRVPQTEAWGEGRWAGGRRSVRGPPQPAPWAQLKHPGAARRARAGLPS